MVANRNCHINLVVLVVIFTVQLIMSLWAIWWHHMYCTEPEPEATLLEPVYDTTLAHSPSEGKCKFTLPLDNSHTVQLILKGRSNCKVPISG